MKEILRCLYGTSAKYPPFTGSDIFITTLLLSFTARLRQKNTATVRLSVNKAVLLQNNIFLHNNALTPTDMRQHYLWGLPFLVSKIYHFEMRCSFVAIKILLCRSWETKQGCHLARLSDKGIMKFYARNQYFLMNTQPTAAVKIYNQ